MDLCAWPSWSCVEVKPIQASTIHMPAVGKNEDCLSWSRLARNACLERQPARGFAEDSIWFLGSKKQTIQISIHKYIIHKYAYVYIYIYIYTHESTYIYDGLSKCLFPVLLINRNSMRAASCLPLKNMTYLDDVKTWKFFVTFGNLSKITGIG